MRATNSNNQVPNTKQTRNAAGFGQTTSITRCSAFSATLAGILWFAPAVLAADLKPETLQQWDTYLKAVGARNQQRLTAGASFLLSDDVPGQTARLRAGEIVVWPVGEHVPMKIASGLIHDWIGAVFIPNTTLSAVLPLIRDYDQYKDFYQPNVIESKWIATADSKDTFSIVIMNKSVVAKTALDCDYQAQYTRLDDHRWYSVGDTNRIQEIADYDTPSQRMLPENHGTGLIWRLHGATRYEERDGGVYIESESVALSRDIPGGLRWFIDPLVRRVSRSSVTTSLRQTETAVKVHSSSAITFNTGPTGNANPAAAVRRFR